MGPQAYTIFNKLKQTKKEKQNKTDGVGRREYSTRSFLSEESQNIPQIFSSTSSLIFVFIARKNLWASYTEVKPQGNHASPVSHSEHIRSASPAIKYWPQVGFTKSLTHKSRRDIDAIKLRKILVQPGWFFFFLIGWMIHKKIKCYNYSIQQHPATGKGYIYKSVHFHNKMSYFIADCSFEWPQESPETKSCPKCSQLWVLILHSYPYMNALIRWCTDLKGLASYVNGCYCL